MTPWTIAHQVSLSGEFPRQEYWSGLPFIPPGDLPDPEIETGPPALQVDSLPWILYRWILEAYKLMLQCYLTKHHTQLYIILYHTGVAKSWTQLSN